MVGGVWLVVVVSWWWLVVVVSGGGWWCKVGMWDNRKRQFGKGGTQKR